jgi:hypothetical protein
MDRSGSWEPGTPERRPWTQGPWHDDSWRAAPTDQARGQDAWNQGPRAGTGFGDGAFAGDWSVATVAARTLARRVLRFVLLSALAGFAVAAVLIALAVAVWPHGFLAALLVLLAVPVLLVSLAMAAVARAGRRAWRRGAWLEAVPMAAGQPWLSRVIWAVRAALAGQAFRRHGRRGRRPEYQARTGDLSGTTR